MKKAILLTLLLVLLLMPFTVSGTALAEDEGKLYYYASSEIPVFADTDGGSPIFYIPATYAYQLDTEVEGKDFVKITYNGKEGYIGKELHKSTNEIKLDWQGNYFFTPDFTLSSDNTGMVNIYTDNTFSEFNPCSPASVTINKVYSYLRVNNTYYFYVNYKYGSFPEDDGYIKASDTSLSDFTNLSVPQNPYYAEETAPEENQSGDISGANPDGLQEPTNNLERYLLIAVIAVLCLVIVVLIFLPNKNRKAN